MIKDGWHVVYGWKVYTENGIVIKGMKTDSNGYYVAAYPYKRNKKFGGWDREYVTIETFCRGVKSGTWILS